MLPLTRPTLATVVAVILAALALLPSLTSAAQANELSMGEAPHASGTAYDGRAQESHLHSGRPLVSGPIRTYSFESVQLLAAYGTPTWLAYDSGVRSFYVAQTNSIVGVIPAGSRSVAVSIPVGSAPFGVAYDPKDGRLFVANSGSNNLSVISDATNSTIGSIPVGHQPYGVAYDGALGEVFVANGGSASVTILNASSLRVLANISVGTDPVGIAWNPVSGNVFVANEASSSVSVISTSTNTVVVSHQVPTGPYGVTVDNSTGEVYVSESQSGAVTVLPPSGSSAATNISVGGTPEGLTYDWRSRTVWVADGAIMVTVINATNHRILQDLLFDPLGAAYNPDRNEICVTNAANSTFQCLVLGVWGSYLSNVNFTEAGLAAGTKWAVSIENDFGFGWGGPGYRQSSTTSAIALQVEEPFGFTYQVLPLSGYNASPASWSFGGYHRWFNISINFTQAPARYVATFIEHGLGFNPWTPLVWGVNLSSVVILATTDTLPVALSNGTFQFHAISVSGYKSPPAADFTVTGSDLTIDVNYALTSYPVTFIEAGLPVGTSWGLAFSGASATTSTSTSIRFQVPNGSYTFSVGHVPEFSPLPASGILTVAGIAVITNVTFAAVPYSANFSYIIRDAICYDSGAVANEVTLSATASGGAPPYTYQWTLPTGSATGSRANSTLTWPWGRNVTLVASDSTGRTTSVTKELPMALPPCPPPPPPNQASPASSRSTFLGFDLSLWVIIIGVVVGTALVGPAAWLLTRSRKRL